MTETLTETRVAAVAEQTVENIVGNTAEETVKQTVEQKPQREFDVLTFGETMVRLSAPGFSRLEEATSLDLRIGGSESNTAVALARLGMRVAWWSKLPANPLGRRIENEIRRWGVDTNGVVWDSSPAARAGTYFLDFGVSPRGIDVYYDRANSSASTLTPEEVDTARIGRARLLHLSGITLAISPTAAAAALHAVAAAKAAGTKVSFDINYRAKLWDAPTARKVLEPLLPHIDMLVTPQADADLILGVTGTGSEVAQTLRSRYGCDAVVVTIGGGGAIGYDSSGECVASPHTLGTIVDRVGAGDAFNAGVIMGYLENDLNLGMEYATAMAALKHTMPGDLLHSTRAEIEAARARTSGGIRR